MGGKLHVRSCERLGGYQRAYAFNGFRFVDGAEMSAPSTGDQAALALAKAWASCVSFLSVANSSASVAFSSGMASFRPSWFAHAMSVP